MDLQRRKIACIVGKIIKGRIKKSSTFLLSHLVTGRCPCSCSTCLWKDNNQYELDSEVIANFYREAAINGFVGNVLWGGEPLMREDLPRLLSILQAEDMLTVLITNGYYLQERYQDIMPYTDTLIVSLDYSEPEKHDYSRGCSGLYFKVIEGIEKVKSEFPGVRIYIICLLHRGNEKELEKMTYLARDLGVSIFFSPAMVGFSPERGRDNTDTVMSPDSLKGAAKKLLNLKKEGFGVNNSRSYLKGHLMDNKGYRCRVPLIFINVMADGTVYNCFTPEALVGDLKDESLEKIIKRQDIKELIALGDRCQKCIVPDVVDTSYLWKLRPEPLFNALKVFF